LKFGGEELVQDEVACVEVAGVEVSLLFDASNKDFSEFDIPRRASANVADGKLELEGATPAKEVLFPNDAGE